MENHSQYVRVFFVCAGVSVVTLQVTLSIRYSSAVTSVLLPRTNGAFTVQHTSPLAGRRLEPRSARLRVPPLLAPEVHFLSVFLVCLASRLLYSLACRCASSASCVVRSRSGIQIPTDAQQGHSNLPVVRKWASQQIHTVSNTMC